MVDKEVIKSQFNSLKPCCVSLMKEKSLSAVLKVHHVIESLAPITNSLLEYVLLPLQMSLHHSTIK